MEISIPYQIDRKWISAGGGALPENGQICAGIYKYGHCSIGILQYREPDQIWGKGPYFLSLTDLWQQMEVGDPDVYYPTFASMEILSYWMPLELPEGAEERIDKQIRQNYMYDEEE